MMTRRGRRWAQVAFGLLSIAQGHTLRNVSSSPAWCRRRQRPGVQRPRHVGEPPPGAALTAHRLLHFPTAAHPRPCTAAHVTRVTGVSTCRRRHRHSRLLRRCCRFRLSFGAVPELRPVWRFCLCNFALGRVAAKRRVCLRTLFCRTGWGGGRCELFDNLPPVRKARHETRRRAWVCSCSCGNGPLHGRQRRVVRRHAGALAKGKLE